MAHVLKRPASCRVDFNVQRNGDIGSPRQPGSTRPSRSANNVGSTSSKRGRPPPSRRTRPVGSSPVSNALAPSNTVFRDIPEHPATTVTPPRPNNRAIPPASNRRCFSSRCPNMKSKNPLKASSSWTHTNTLPHPNHQRADSSFPDPNAGLTFEVNGCCCPAGNAVTYPAAAGAVTVRFSTTAVAPERAENSSGHPGEPMLSIFSCGRARVCDRTCRRGHGRPRWASTASTRAPSTEGNQPRRHSPTMPDPLNPDTPG